MIKYNIGRIRYHYKLSFITCCCMWLSKDTVLYLINNKNNKNYRKPYYVI